MHRTMKTFIFSVICVVLVVVDSVMLLAGRDNGISEAAIDSAEVVAEQLDEPETQPRVIYLDYPAEEPIQEPEKEPLLSDEDISLIALVTMAEAEGECEEGQRLVIDTILNRTDSERFPDSVYGVIYQPSQFSSMWNGRVKRCEVQDDIYQLVLEELEERTDNDVMFFTAGNYSKYGTPMFQVGNHYFSSYD